MKPETWAAICASFEPHRITYATPVPREEILRAQERLGVKFDAVYVEFVERFGGAILNGIELFGLRQCDLAAPNCWSVITETESCRESYGDAIKDWYIVSADNGYPVGITSNGEVAGYYYDASPSPVRIIAKSFEEFLMKCADPQDDPFDIWGK